MEKVYEELDEVKAANEKLRMDYRNKTEILDNLKKVQKEQLVDIREARLVNEKQCFEIEEKTRDVSELKRANEDLQRCLREKDSVLKRVNDANDKLRANGEDKYRELEEEKRSMMSALDEATEKNIDLEQENNVYRAEIEGLKGLLGAAEKKRIQVEKTVEAMKEMRGRDDMVIKMEEEKAQVEEKLKWKKEQFKHLEEAYEKLQNLFKASKKEWEEEKSTLLDEIYSLQAKLDSLTRISEDLQKKLQMSNSALTQEETRRKRLEVQVSEFKTRYEDAFAEYKDARTQLDDLAGKRDEEVAELRQSLSMKDTYLKEMKYENGKLEQENQELLGSLKELQEATIQGSGNSALSKLKNKFRNLENIHKTCSANLRSKEAEWSSRLDKMAEEINDYQLRLQSKEEALKDVELELENCHSSAAKVRLQYEEISVMFLVLSRTVSEAQSRLANVKDEQIKDEKREEKSYSLLMEQLDQKNAALAKAHLEIEEERERVACLLKRIDMLDLIEDQKIQMEKEVERYKEMVEESSRFQTQMKEKLEEAENDYEEKLLQVCDALDNTNSDLVSEREKVVALTRQIESFGFVKEKNLVMEKEIEKYKEMLEESQKSRVLLEEQISQLESDSKENIRELCSKVDIAYAKLAEEVEKTTSLVRKSEAIDLNEENREQELDNYKGRLEESTKSQLRLQEKVVEVENDSKRKLADVSEALETANSELSDKTSEVYQIEFQLWIWKSIAKRLKAELEQNQNLRKRVEASLIEQVGVGEAIMQERNELMHKLKSINSTRSSVSEIETLMRDKDDILENLQRELELLEQESLSRELEDVFIAHTIAETELQKEREIFAGALQQKEQDLREVKHKWEGSFKSVSLLLAEEQNKVNMLHKAWEKLSATQILTAVESESKKMMIIELEGEIFSLSKKLKASGENASCFRQEATKLGAELETKQRELKEVTTQMQVKLKTSEAEKTELVKEVASLSSEKGNLLSFISAMEDGMLKLCDGDTKLMKTLERVTQCCDGFGKENNNGETTGSPRLAMKHEDAVIEDRSPFRQLNH
ncbi:uncharacterized protein At4g38062 [Capsella rubella]|uniref:uncharacterized protein At4g38062 n=1 Tax=Capsella rubella TaxID=81985 RepID=UPI000CD552ED|nr:uncharacterized protein At4g38062 [Capsella rubella]